jgi:hypothetical protein
LTWIYEGDVEEDLLEDAGTLLKEMISSRDFNFYVYLYSKKKNQGYDNANIKFEMGFTTEDYYGMPSDTKNLLLENYLISVLEEADDLLLKVKNNMI